VPNPAHDIIFIKSNVVIGVVSIFNSLGYELINETINEYEKCINISLLKSGTYFVKVFTSSGKTTFEKLIIQ